MTLAPATSVMNNELGVCIVSNDILRVDKSLKQALLLRNVLSLNI